MVEELQSEIVAAEQQHRCRDVNLYCYLKRRGEALRVSDKIIIQYRIVNIVSLSHCLFTLFINC